MTAPQRRLHRSHDRKIAGVCGGIAEYFGVDPTLVRVGFAALVLLSAGAGGVLLYLLLWLVMPAADAAPASLEGRPGLDGGLLLGVALVVIGGIALLQRMPVLWAFGAGVFRFSIPLAIIAVGVLLLMSRGRR